MTCSCGHDLKAEAETREQAVKSVQSQMDEKAIKDHYDQFHEGESIPSVAQVHDMISQNLGLVTV
jgi:hypothetical protein